MKWGCVILAGGKVDETLAAAIGTERKALAKVGGATSVERVFAAARAAGLEDIKVVGGPEVLDLLPSGTGVLEGGGQMANAKIGFGALPPVDAVLWLPADAPFLQPEGIRHYLRSVEARARPVTWLSAGLAPLAWCMKAFPDSTPDSLRLKEGRYRSGAYFATSPEAFLHASALLEQVMANRRSQVRMLLQLGPWPMVKYFSGQATISDAERILGRLLGADGIVVADCDPEMAVDIDTKEEWALVQAHSSSYPAFRS